MDTVSLCGTDAADVFTWLLGRDNYNVPSGPFIRLYTEENEMYGRNIYFVLNQTFT